MIIFTKWRSLIWFIFCSFKMPIFVTISPYYLDNISLILLRDMGRVASNQRHKYSIRAGVCYQKFIIATYYCWRQTYCLWGLGDRILRESENGKVRNLIVVVIDFISVDCSHNWTSILRELNCRLIDAFCTNRVMGRQRITTWPIMRLMQ